MTKTMDWSSPVGLLRITETDGALSSLLFLGVTGAEDAPSEGATPLLSRTVAELDEYFRGRRKVFDIPLAPVGTTFQHQVWQALLAIPYGEIRSYGQIAASIGRPKACRAVGMANNRNPLPIIVPCHRVIGSTGALVGYAGGLAIKQQLLELERSNV